MESDRGSRHIADLERANKQLRCEVAERERAEIALKQRVVEMAAVNSLGRRVSASLSLDQVIQAALKEIVSTIAPDFALLYIRHGDELVLGGSHPVQPDFHREEIRRKRVGRCLCGIAAEGKPVYSENIHADKRCTLTECKAAGIRSFAAVPTLKGDEVLGVLGVASTRRRDFSQQAVFLETLAGQVAIGLQNALLHEEVQRHAAELEQRVIECERAEGEVRESERRYRELVEGSRDGYAMVDMAGRIQRYNSSFRDMLGYTDEELVEKTYEDITPVEWHADEASILDKQVFARGYSDVYEKEYRRKDGSIFPIEIRTYLVKDEKGTLIGIWAFVRDVTHRKQSEERLRLLSSAVEQTGEGIAVVDMDGRVLFSNNAFAHMHGYTPDELSGKHLSIFHTTEQMPVVVEANRQMKQAGEFSGEIWHTRRDGTVFPTLMHNSLLRDGKGNVVGMIGTLRDITEEKLAEDRLRRARQAWEDIFQAIGHPTLILDKDHRVIHANRAVTDAVGLPEADLMGKKCYEIFHGTDQYPPDCPMEKMRRSGHLETVDMEVEALRGTYLVSCTPVLDDRGELDRVIHVATDITERKRAEEQVRQEYSFRMAIIERAAEGLCVCHEIPDQPHISFTVWNSRMTEITGYTMDEINRLGWYETMYPDPEVRSQVQERMKRMRLGDDLHSEEWEVTRADGEKRVLSISTSILQSGDGEVHVLALMDDITERRRAEEVRRAAERELEMQRALSLHSDRLRSLGEMAAGIAHELNQPLVGVRGLSEHLLLAMERDWDISKEKVREKIRLIVEQADRMTHIIQHVRVFARESGKPDVSPINVNDVVESSRGMVGAQFRAHGIEMIGELAEDLPMVLANPFSLEEVLLNLLLNARDAVEEKQAATPISTLERVRLRTSVQDVGLERSVRVQVTDSGVGIPPGMLDKVFDPFYTTKSPDKGTGLGLAVSRSIVQSFGGTIEIESTPGQGTTVTISLPAQKE